MNIENLSSATLEKFISLGYINDFKSIYHLSEHKNKLMRLDGFGAKSIQKLLDSIEKSRDIKLENFITALSIPDVGLSTAKTIAARFDDYRSFIVRATDFKWEELDGIGNLTAEKISDFINTNLDEIRELAKEFNFIEESKAEVKANPFNGKSVAVTGKLIHFNRDSINAKLESLGAKPASGVTTKTHYLINNDPTSNSSKNKKANELNIPIITEDEFLKMIGE
jgi:DNA ligase (NAD+)